MLSPLDRIIPAEIRDDELYRLLGKLTAAEPMQTVLEIGSSSGEGSTAALVTGLKRNPGRPMLFCLEASRTRFEQLAHRYENEPFVRCLNASSVTLDRFPSEEEVACFLRTTPTILSTCEIETVLGWLREDVRYLAENGIRQGGIRTIRETYCIDTFDLVLIDGSEFTGTPELDEVIGARWIVLDDINAYKNYSNYHRLAAHPDYRLATENWQLRNGYAVFRHREAALPVHFFTIVLNGMPFMAHHIDVFRHLPFRWHWHIIEGVAELVGDTAWSLPNGGRIPDCYHDHGLSVDGTTSYIDELQRLFPDNITIHRKPSGQFWRGKLEMINAPLAGIDEECLLWEIDADECWTQPQLCAGWRMFHDQPARTAAYYWCHFFVGHRLVVNSRNCYSQVPGQEWLRTWRYRPGHAWAAHEPPRLVDGEQQDLARLQPFFNDETEARGMVFQHFAYATADQVRFKQKYYGYANATYHWLRLQKEDRFPVRLGDYLPWVPDGTTVDTVASRGIIPLPVLNHNRPIKSRHDYRIVIDGVFFQYFNTGIARVWSTLLEVLRGTIIASEIIVLDRGGTFPRIPGYRYLDVPLHDEGDIAAERKLLQAVCDQQEADLFISTWHTSPLSTKSLLMVHDMLPELLLGEQRLREPRWQEKEMAIRHAAAYVTVSENTARDLVKWYPETLSKPIHVMHNGVAPSFRPAPPERINAFRKRHGIDKPYFLYVGPREWYKNFSILLEAFLMLPNGPSYCIVSPHGDRLESEFAGHPAASAVILTGRLTEEELVAAYTGAVALIYPSRCEGFGLPLLEGMACGCPVIAANAPALVEAAGDAALLFPPDNAAALTLAMVKVQQHDTRAGYVRRGRQRAAAFTWDRSASQLVRAICGMLDGRMGLNNILLERMDDGIAND